VNSYESFLKNIVIPRLESVPGVGSAQINSNGGTEELDIVFDPVRAAQLGIQIPQMAQQSAARKTCRAERSMSAGGNMASSSAAAIRSRTSGISSGMARRQARYLGDIADVHIAGARRRGCYQNGNPALGIDIFRADGANVLATVNAVKAELQKINDGPAKEQGVVLAYSSIRRTSSTRPSAW